MKYYKKYKEKGITIVLNLKKLQNSYIREASVTYSLNMACFYWHY